MKKQMTEKTRVEIDVRKPSTVIVNGKEYVYSKTTTKKIDGIIHDDKIIFKPVDEEAVERDKKLVIDTIAKNIPHDELIRELLKEISPSYIKRLATRIRKGKPIKRHHGCIGLKIGDAYVQLIE